MSSYLVPLHKIRDEMSVSNSRFITTLAPAFSIEEAKDFIMHIRQEYTDATHNVPAYLIGGGSSVIEHCSDDGEPSGTAGRPILAVLKGSGLGDVVVVVTRYFGGTKLGTGGLVRAYSEAVRQVINSVQRAERMSTVTVMIELPYRWLERLRRIITTHHGRILEEEFGTNITLSARFPLEHYPAFAENIRQASNNTLDTLVISHEVELVPIASPKP